MGWPLCFLAQCVRKETSLRYQAGLAFLVGAKTCVLVVPTILQKPAYPRFIEIEALRTALGFGIIFSKVKQWISPEMCVRIAAYMGGNGIYYRYLHGERALTPEQQQWIRTLFVRLGIPRRYTFRRQRGAVPLLRHIALVLLPCRGNNITTYW